MGVKSGAASKKPYIPPVNTGKRQMDLGGKKSPNQTPPGGSKGGDEVVSDLNFVIHVSGFIVGVYLYDILFLLFNPFIWRFLSVL